VQIDKHVLGVAAQHRIKQLAIAEVNSRWVAYNANK